MKIIDSGYVILGTTITPLSVGNFGRQTLPHNSLWDSESLGANFESTYKRVCDCHHWSKPSERNELGFGSSERQTAGCKWSLMDAHMPGPICVKLSEFVEGRWGFNSANKKNKKKKNLMKFFWSIFFEEVFCLQPNPTSSLHACRLSRLWGLSPCDTST